jgi:hypothetical protein
MGLDYRQGGVSARRQAFAGLGGSGGLYIIAGCNPQQGLFVTWV